MFSLLEKSYRYAFQNNIPLTATIELTHDCNFGCQHCYNFDRTASQQKSKTSESKKLSKEKVFNAINELHKLGNLILNFTGGEVCLVPELAEYIRHARTLHLQPRIKSNASLISKEKAVELAQAGLAGADISIYGYSQETYTNFTQNRFARDNMIKGIDHLIDQGIEVLVSIILHRNNVHELKDMVNFCEERNIRYNISTEITERYDGTTSSKSSEITQEQFIELLSGEFSHFFQHTNESNSYQCSCARSMIGIGHQGDVYPCIGAPIKAGSINSDSLINIWKNSKVFNSIRSLKKSDFKNCETCAVAESCNRSSGSIYINTGEYTGCDSSTYKQARIRHELKQSKSSYQNA